MAHSIWFRSQGDLSREVVSASLAREGILLSDPEDDPPEGCGLFLFSKAGPEIFEEVCRLSRQGDNHVLTVAENQVDLYDGTAWKLLQSGAADVFAWDSMENPSSAIAARLERYAEVDELVGSELVKNKLVGQSSIWINVLRQLAEVGRFTDVSVLLTGESGTGKELAARLIHILDPRPEKRTFVVLDCTTVVPELAGSEFFGHERGAFTHAVSARDGAFALADGGTLFLDEVGELPLTLQAELLRVVQEGIYKRVGSNTWRKTNFRLICATNRDLMKEQQQGSFRSDFYHRIASWTCTLPPIRERREDILPLARHFLSQINPDRSRPPMDPLVKDFLMMREYPGNVRELRQLVYRIGKRHVGDGPITIGDIPEEERNRAAEDFQKPWHDGPFHGVLRRALASGVGLKEITNQAAETTIQIALTEADGNLRRAAARLKVTDRALQMRRAAVGQQSGNGRSNRVPPLSEDGEES